MGFLRGALKVAGTVALGTTSIAAGFVELATAVVGDNAPGSSELADILGSVRAECFERIDDLWTPDEEKDETYEYLQKKEQRSVTRNYKRKSVRCKVKRVLLLCTLEFWAKERYRQKRTPARTLWPD